MKDKTITVCVPDFCPEDCDEFDCVTDIREYRDVNGNLWKDRGFRCKHEYLCWALHSSVARGYLAKHGCCNDCHNPKCEWKPELGDDVRINCPHWRGEI